MNTNTNSMNKVYSDTGNVLLGLEQAQNNRLAQPSQFAEYTVLLIEEGQGIFHADFASFAFTAPVLLFSTPQQSIYIKEAQSLRYTMLQFHSDFYCIEYHRNEVACNGLLFNNIYIEPSLKLSVQQLDSYIQIIDQITSEFRQTDPSDIVLRAYLQLFLAKSSSIKLNTGEKQKVIKDEKMELFKQLLEKHFLTLHKPGDYASLLSMSPNNFSRQCSKCFNKTPSQMIQERLILEAKKQLHLTRLSIKEIAYALKFEDEYYFSRFFKKMTKISPQAFRSTTGISIVADLSS